MGLGDLLKQVGSPPVQGHTLYGGVPPSPSLTVRCRTLAGWIGMSSAPSSSLWRTRTRRRCGRP